MLLVTPLGIFSHVLVLLNIIVVLAEASSYYPKKELWPYYQIKMCDLNCPHGFMTDMEGRYFCKCYDPCRNIYCHSGTKCVVSEVKSLNCNWSSCRPEGHCKEIGPKKTKTNKKILNKPQRDDGSVTSSEKGSNDVCRLPLQEEAKQCTKLRKRWYFDPISGQCRKFRGCRTGGNNFGRKKRCKRKCLRKTKFARRKGRVSGRRFRRFMTT